MKRYILFIMLVLIQTYSQVKALDFQQFDINDKNVLNEVVRAYQEEYKNKRGTSEAEETYLEFVNFHDNFVHTFSDQIANDGELALTQSARVKTIFFNKPKILYRRGSEYSWVSPLEIAKILSDKYSKYGLVVLFEENYFYPQYSYKYEYENFGPYLDKATRELLKFRASHFDKTIVSDAHYIISEKKIKQIIRFYKKYKEKFPEKTDKYLVDENIKYWTNALNTYPNVSY